ncbi:MAG: hypothetical protein AAFR79_02150 [Pseudomonadota bacterium]
MRAVLGICLAVAASGMAMAACPPHTPDAERRAELFAALAAAPDEATAREISFVIRRFWSEAPDAKAQALLDHIYDRRRWQDLEAAEEASRELTAYCPDYAEGWNQLATVLFYRERYDASLDAIIRTLELEPDHFGALAGRGVILMQQGRVALGQIALREAVALYPLMSERHLLIPEPGQKL